MRFLENTSRNGYIPWDEETASLILIELMVKIWVNKNYFIVNARLLKDCCNWFLLTLLEKRMDEHIIWNKSSVSILFLNLLGVLLFVFNFSGPVIFSWIHPLTFVDKNPFMFITLFYLIYQFWIHFYY